MNQKGFIFIIVLITVALIGLTVIQSYWIKNAITVKEANFVRSVNEAISNVVYKLEKTEAANRLQSQMDLMQQRQKWLQSIDSLNQAISVNNLYIENIQQVLKGEIKRVTFNKDSVLKQLQIDKIDFAPSAVDSAFREEVEQLDRFSVFSEATKSNDIVFTSPIKGEITENYNSKEKHFAIDIAVENDTPVKAVADGTVIFSGFTADTGYVIVLEHSQGFISVYKHNSSIFKNQGELVVSGEVISSAGSTGAFSTGPHLHFELWNDGYPVNPSNYINFE